MLCSFQKTLFFVFVFVFSVCLSLGLFQDMLLFVVVFSKTIFVKSCLLIPMTKCKKCVYQKIYFVIAEKIWLNINETIIVGHTSESNVEARTGNYFAS